MAVASHTNDMKLAALLRDMELDHVRENKKPLYVKVQEYLCNSKGAMAFIIGLLTLFIFLSLMPTGKGLLSSPATIIGLSISSGALYFILTKNCDSGQMDQTV